MNTTTQRNDTNGRYSLLATVRALVPRRRLSFNEALRVTELEANAVRRELGITGPELPEDAIASIPRVQVVELDDLPSSGVNQWHNGRWVIAINGWEPWQRQRFTVAHELAHVINYQTDH